MQKCKWEIWSLVAGENAHWSETGTAEQGRLGKIAREHLRWVRGD